MAKEAVKIEEAKPYDPYEDRVIVNIAPPSEDDIGKSMYISVNDYNAQIQYGEDVAVPRFVRDALNCRKIALNEKRANEKKRAAQLAKLEKME